MIKILLFFAHGAAKKSWLLDSITSWSAAPSALRPSFNAIDVIDHDDIRHVRSEAEEGMRSQPEPEVTQPASSPPDPNEIRVLSYNFFIRPPMPPLIAPGDYKNERIELFKRYYLENYDLILFQELFGSFSSKRTKLLQSAKKLGYHSHASPQPAKRRFQAIVDGGLVTLSKFPITSTDFHAYKEGCCTDNIALKGVLYTLIEIDSTHSIHVFNTHLQASYVKGDYHQTSKIRRNQVREMVEFMHSKVKQHPHFPIFLGGDFNINARPSAEEKSKGRTESWEFQTLRESLNTISTTNDILFQAYGEHPVTMCNTHADPRELVLTPAEDYKGVDADASLDHQFLFQNGNNWLSVKKGSAKVQEVHVEPTKAYPSIQLSDHYGVESILAIDRTRMQPEPEPESKI